MSQFHFWKFSDSFFVLCKLTEKGLRPFQFELKILNGATVWKAEITNEILQELADKANLSINEFCFITRRALIGESPDEPNEIFVYEIKNDKFYWKKKMVEGVQYQLGVVSVTKLNGDRLDESIESILNYSFDRIQNLKEKSESLEQECFTANQERIGALERLNESIQAKNECENLFLTKFAEILNSKKRKIVELLHHDDNETKKIDTKSKKVRGNEPDINDEGMDTDEEKEFMEASRTISTTETEYRSSSTPLLDDDELIVHSTVAKKDKKNSLNPEASGSLFVPKRGGRPARGGRNKKASQEKESSGIQKEAAPNRRRSQRTSSQLSSSSLFEKLS